MFRQVNCLDAHWFTTIAEAKQLIEAWRREYKESRPHRVLREHTPGEFAAQRELTSSQETENSPWRWHRKAEPPIRNRL